ncbi:MAG: Xaa-Pro peptidase family protein [Ardenticatenales bacterium]
MHLERLTALREAIADAGLDAIAIVPGPNLVFLTGLHFHLSERATILIVPHSGQPMFIVPALEETKARTLPFDADLFPWADADGPTAAVAAAALAVDLAGKRLGVEGRRIRFLELDALAKSGAAPVVENGDAVFATLRMTKDAAALAAMRSAVAVAEAAFASTLEFVRPGVTEKQVAAELMVQTFNAGSGELPFQPIIASGPNGANPHAGAGDRALQPGDVVTIDWGATVDGYASDLTRCVVIAGAAPDPRIVAAYAAVRAANAAGRAAARPGGTGQDVDRAARQAIVDAGLGEYFIHRTGHGLGLECHEEPDMSEVSRTPLAPGMTFTVEPGVYIPGVGGVRIEDDVVITADGAETLSTLSRELLVVGG